MIETFRAENQKMKSLVTAMKMENSERGGGGKDFFRGLRAVRHGDPTTTCTAIVSPLPLLSIRSTRPSKWPILRDHRAPARVRQGGAQIRSHRQARFVRSAAG
jgi:hypothetical protein